MTSNNLQLHNQAGGTVIRYALNPYASNTQVTLGGRATGITKYKYRPILNESLPVAIADFEVPADNSINFAPVSGVTVHTFVIENRRCSYLIIDDTGNTGGFWVNITQS